MSAATISSSVSAARIQLEFERECILLFSEIVEVFGVARSVGQIYGLLFASPNPLSFSDIVERLGISKGSASQGLQLLRTLGAIRLTSLNEGRIGVRATGKAREYYEPELSLRKLVSGVLQERIAPMAMVGAGHFARLQDIVEKAGRQNPLLVEKVEQLETWRKRFRTVLPVLTALLGPKDRS